MLQVLRFEFLKFKIFAILNFHPYILGQKRNAAYKD